MLNHFDAISSFDPHQPIRYHINGVAAKEAGVDCGASQ